MLSVFFQVNPGAVESILCDPNDPNRILIGYARGLIALWDTKSNSSAKTYVSSQQLESLAWRNDGSQFVSAHNDGSFVIWSKEGSDEPLEPPNTPYGPYPCKAMNKILWAHDNGTAWLVFSGGMPRASYGDKFTVTVMQGEDTHVVFDLSSKIIDFQLIHGSPSERAPDSLVILAEEELVVIDLKAEDDSWPIFSAPYLNSIHASAITCINHIGDVSKEVFKKLSDSGNTVGRKDKVSERPWPIDGGTVDEKQDDKKDILITGHEDGSVKLWSCSGISLSLLSVIKTNKFFIGDELDEPPPEDEDDEEEEWPPFKKIGQYDPYSDDPRLAVKKVWFCPDSGRLVIGGTAGQVVICDLKDEANDKAVLQVVKADLVTEKEGFTWKGHSALTVRSNELKLTPGFQPRFVVQVSPPASINSLSASSTWNLVAAGTAHGLVIMDCIQNESVMVKCTLNAQGNIDFFFNTR